MADFSNTLNGSTFEHVASISALGRNFSMWMVEDASINDSLTGDSITFSGSGIYWKSKVTGKREPVTYVQGMNCRKVLMMDKPGYTRASFAVRFLRDQRFGAGGDIPTVNVNDFDQPEQIPYCKEGATDDESLELRYHAFNMVADRMRSCVNSNKYKPGLYVIHLVMTYRAMGDFQVLPAPQVHNLNAPGVNATVAYADDDGVFVRKGLVRVMADRFLGFEGSAYAATLSSGGARMDRVSLLRR